MRIPVRADRDRRSGPCTEGVQLSCHFHSWEVRRIPAPQAPQTPRDGWLGVELRHLAALAAIDRSGSFRGAAVQLGYVQSAVSQQIAFLERLVGARLVHRSPGPGPVTLTETGVVLLHHATTILDGLHAARADLGMLAPGAPGQLRLGVAGAPAQRLLAHVIPEFLRSADKLGVAPRDMVDEQELIDAVARGELDAALAELPLPPGPFTSVEVAAIPYVLLVCADAPAPDPKALRLLVPEAPPPAIERLRAAGMNVDPQSLTISPVTAQSLACAGVAAAVLPLVMVDPAPPGCATHALGTLLPPRRLAVCWHAERQVQGAVTAFAQAALRACRDAGLGVD
jgi:DNA-binding transcriptional LysR family regulator